MSPVLQAPRAHNRFGVSVTKNLRHPWREEPILDVRQPLEMKTPAAAREFHMPSAWIRRRPARHS